MVKNDESLRKNVFAEIWNEEKHFGKNSWFARPNGTEDTKVDQNNKIRKFRKFNKWSWIVEALLLKQDWKYFPDAEPRLWIFAHQIFAKIALVISRFLARKFKYGKAITTPPIGWVSKR